MLQGRSYLIHPTTHMCLHPQPPAQRSCGEQRTPCGWGLWPADWGRERAMRYSVFQVIRLHSTTLRGQGNSLILPIASHLGPSRA